MDTIPPVKFKDRWYWCSHCRRAAISCEHCHNTSCNGGGCELCEKDFGEAIEMVNKGLAPKKEELEVHYAEIDILERKIFAYLDEHEVISDEYLAYNEDKYPFDLQDFHNLTEWIWDKAGGWDASDKYYVEGAAFENYLIPYTYNGKEYVLDIMYGQGSSWILKTRKQHEECLIRMKHFNETGKWLE